MAQFAPQHRRHARQQLARAERFADVIVAAWFETEYTVEPLVAARQEDDGQAAMRWISRHVATPSSSGIKMSSTTKSGLTELVERVEERTACRPRSGSNCSRPTASQC